MQKNTHRQNHIEPSFQCIDWIIMCPIKNGGYFHFKKRQNKTFQIRKRLVSLDVSKAVYILDLKTPELY